MYKTSIGDFYFINPFIDNEEDYDKYFNHNKKNKDNDDTEKLTYILNILEALYNTHDSDTDSDKEDKEDYDDEAGEDKNYIKDFANIPTDVLPKKKLDFNYKNKDENKKTKITKSEALYLLGLDENKYEII